MNLTEQFAFIRTGQMYNDLSPDLIAAWEKADHLTKDIPVGVIAVGNPCKVIRSITDNDETGFVSQPTAE
jgi:hypothetical protein